MHWMTSFPITKRLQWNSSYKLNAFYIVRHGETENNRAKRLSGWIDTPLTDTGLQPTTKKYSGGQG